MRMSEQTAVLPFYEKSVKDDFGRVTCYQYKDFWAYVDKKKKTKADLFKMRTEQREDFFMAWKHGMTDMNVNWEFEYALRHFLRNFQDIPVDTIDPYFMDAVLDRRKFEEYCEKIKNEIGLWSGKREVPSEVKNLVDLVGGTIVGDIHHG